MAYLAQQSVGDTFGTIPHPSELDRLFEGQTGDTGLGIALSGIIELIYIIAAVIFIFFLLWSALEFIYSRGDKEHIQSARGRLTWALIGLILLGISFVLIRIIGTIVGFQFFGGELSTPITGQTTQTSQAQNSDSRNPFQRIVDSLGEKGSREYDIGTCPPFEPPLRNNGVDIRQPEAICIPKNTFWDSFAGDCSAGCKVPIVEIPYIYHQYDVKLNHQGELGSPIDEYLVYNCTEDQMATTTNAGGAACLPTSLAMEVEALNRNSNKSIGVNHQTANDLTRLLLNRRLMTCVNGADFSRIEQYLGNLTYETVQNEFHMNFKGPINAPWENLVSDYQKYGRPIVTRAYFATDRASPHYVVVAGISDNYVWVADPLSAGPRPDQQYYLRYPKEYFENNYYGGRYLDISLI